MRSCEQWPQADPLRHRESSLEGARLQQTRHFKLWVQSCSSTTMEHGVADHVVPSGPVATVRADKGMVAACIRDRLAFREGRTQLGKRGAKPPLQHGFEEDWFSLGVGGQRRQSDHLPACSAPDRLQVGQMINLLPQVGLKQPMVWLSKAWESKHCEGAWRRMWESLTLQTHRC